MSHIEIPSNLPQILRKNFPILIPKTVNEELNSNLLKDINDHLNVTRDDKVTAVHSEYGGNE